MLGGVGGLTVPLWTSSGEGEDWGERLPGNGGALTYFPCEKKSTWKRNQAPEDTGSHRRTEGGKGRDTKETEGHMMGEPLRG